MWSVKLCPKIRPELGGLVFALALRFFLSDDAYTHNNNSGSVRVMMMMMVMVLSVDAMLLLLLSSIEQY